MGNKVVILENKADAVVPISVPSTPLKSDVGLPLYISPLSYLSRPPMCLIASSFRLLKDPGNKLISLNKTHII